MNEMNVDEHEIIMQLADMFRFHGFFPCLNINPVIDFKVQNELTFSFGRNYDIPERPITPITIDNLNLHLKDHKPFQSKQKNFSEEELQPVSDIISSMLSKNLIRESDSNYSSPVNLFMEDNDPKISANYVLLNTYLNNDEKFFSHADDPVNKLINKTYFSALYLENSFELVSIAEESRKYTAFTIPNLGTYEFNKMPYGLKNSFIKFQHFVYLALKELIDPEKIFLYSNNILIGTNTLDEQLNILERLFQLLVANKLELQLDKCQFLYPKIEYLGYKISNNRLKINKKNNEAISRFPVLKNKGELEDFLNITDYFSNLIEDYPLIVKSLYNLLDKYKDYERKHKFDENELNTDAFYKLKKILITPPVFRIFNPNNETELHCDAGNTGFGVTIVQKFEDDLWHPVTFHSQMFTTEEAQYGSSQREMLALYHALETYKHYLQGIKFKIITDCQSLVIINLQKGRDKFPSKWYERIQMFYCSLEHRKREHLKHVDALSHITKREESFFENLLNNEFRLNIAPERTMR